MLDRMIHSDKISQYITTVKRQSRNTLLSHYNAFDTNFKSMTTNDDNQTERHRNAVRLFQKKHDLSNAAWSRASNNKPTEGAIRAYLRKDAPTNMTLKNLAALAKAANVTLSEMLGEEVPEMETRPIDTAIHDSFKILFKALASDVPPTLDSLSEALATQEAHYKRSADLADASHWFRSLWVSLNTLSPKPPAPKAKRVAQREKVE